MPMWQDIIINFEWNQVLTTRFSEKAVIFKGYTAILDSGTGISGCKTLFIQLANKAKSGPLGTTGSSFM